MAASTDALRTHGLRKTFEAETVPIRALCGVDLNIGHRLDLYARPYVGSVMFTPPTNRTRMLFTVWPDTAGTRTWMSADAFEQFVAEISADETRRQLGRPTRSVFLTRRPLESSLRGWSAYSTSRSQEASGSNFGSVVCQPGIHLG